MAVLQVLHIPDERLRIVAEPVKEAVSYTHLTLPTKLEV